jgi:hypothetical protein
MAKIKTITVRSASNISHPNPTHNEKLKFTQLKSEVELTAELSAKDNLDEVFTDLQITVDALRKQHITEQYNAANGGNKNG